MSDTVSYESLVCFSNHTFSAIIIIIYFYWNVQLLKFINLINFFNPQVQSTVQSHKQEYSKSLGKLQVDQAKLQDMKVKGKSIMGPATMSIPSFTLCHNCS